MADHMNNTTNNTGARSGRRGLRASIGVGLLSLGLASGAGVMAMSAQPASAATFGGSTVVVKLPVLAPFPGGVVQSLGVSWS